MNFDFGDLLTRAWKITWKHKVLWALSVLPFLTVFLLLPVWLALFQENADDALSTWMQNPILMSIAVIWYLIVFAASIFLQVVSRASVTLGIYRAEVSLQPVRFVDLFQDGFRYFWRILGLVCLIGAAIAAIFLAFFVFLGVFSLLTMGLGIFCIQPVLLLMIPLFMLVLALVEQSSAAIVADEMKTLRALRGAYELIRSHLWKYALITFILYIGISTLTSLVTLPLMLPMFFFMLWNREAGADFNTIIRVQALFGVVILPIMALIQGFSLTYSKSAMMLTYLRLTRSTGSQPLPASAGSTIIKES